MDIDYLYEIQVKCNKNTIEYNTIEPITVSLFDFNKQYMKASTDIIITCSDGYFTSNSSSTNNLGTSQTITTNTGYATFYYKADAFGPIVFNVHAGAIKTECALFVDGFKRIEITTTQGQSPRPLYVNPYRRQAFFSYYFKKQNITSNLGSQIACEGAIIPSEYRPPYRLFENTYHPKLMISMGADGKIYRRTDSSFNMGDEAWVRFEWTY